MGYYRAYVSILRGDLMRWAHKVTVLAGPFEFMIALTCVLSGPILLSGVVPTSIRAEASPLAWVWALEVFLSGLLILVGMWTGRRTVEATGLSLQAAASAVYGIAIWVNLGVGAIIAVLFYLLVLCGGSLLRLVAMREADRTRWRMLRRGA